MADNSLENMNDHKLTHKLPSFNAASVFNAWAADTDRRQDSLITQLIKATYSDICYSL